MCRIKHRRQVVISTPLVFKWAYLFELKPWYFSKPNKDVLVPKPNQRNQLKTGKQNIHFGPNKYWLIILIMLLREGDTVIINLSTTSVDVLLKKKKKKKKKKKIFPQKLFFHCWEQNVHLKPTAGTWVTEEPVLEVIHNLRLEQVFI